MIVPVEPAAAAAAVVEPDHEVRPPVRYARQRSAPPPCIEEKPARRSAAPPPPRRRRKAASQAEALRDAPYFFEDADDLRKAGEAIPPEELELRAALNHLQAEAHYLYQFARNKQERAERTRKRAEAASLARFTEEVNADPDLSHFDPNRLRDITDLRYRFRHREHLSDTVRERLEYIAAKIEYVRANEEPGYHAKLIENGIDYEADASVAACLSDDWVNSYCRCGIWTPGKGGKKNSGRCHQKHFCRFCNWLDFGKLIKASLGQFSGTFERAQAKRLQFFFVTLSVRDNPANARAVGGTMNDGYLNGLRQETGLCGGQYDARPINIDTYHGRDDVPGLETCRAVAGAYMKALRRIKKKRWIQGGRAKLESALAMNPTRALLHCHGIVNGSCSLDAQSLAEMLKEEVDAHLKAHWECLQIPLYADVLVLAITSPEDLEKAALYTEKTVPIGLIAQDAMARPEARDASGHLRPEYVERLIDGFNQLSGQLDNMHTGFYQAGPAAARAVNRWVVGNMRFGKKCILFETEEHRIEREERAKKRRQQRAERKRKDEAEARDAKRHKTTTSEGAGFDRGQVRRRSPRRRPRKSRRRSKAALKKTTASTTAANTTPPSLERGGSNPVNDPSEIASGTIPESTQAISKVLTAEEAQATSVPLLGAPP